MGGILAVAARELKEKWTVIVAAVVAGLVALLVPLFSSLGRHDGRDARELAAFILAGVLACGTAWIVGSGMINRELAERRHGFLFARPLSAGAIWGGKVLACWLLAVGSGFAVLLPAAAVSRGLRLLNETREYANDATVFGVALVALLLLILFAHAITLMVRSHMAWLLALDTVFGIGIILAVALALRSLILAFAFDALVCGAVAFTLALLVALFAAGFAQVSKGRTDIRRGHRVLSLTLWGFLGGAALLLAGFAYWVQAVNPSDLALLEEVVCAPRGGWAFVTGRARGRGNYEPSFLVDTATSRTIRLGARLWWSGPQFSHDGTRAVWLSLSPNAGDLAHDLVTLDLMYPGSGPVTTPITISDQHATLLRISPDGHRLALRDEKTISVEELLTGRLLASVRLPDDLGFVKVLWRAEDRLLVAGWKPTPGSGNEADMRLFEFDVSHRTLTETGRIANVGRLGYFGTVFGPVTGHLVTRIGPRSSTSLVLCDARSGARIATLTSCAGASDCIPIFLSDGAIAVGDVVESGVRLRLFSAVGVLQRTIPIGPGRAINLGAQPTPGTLIVATRAQAADYLRAGCRTFVVDVHTGRINFLGQGYFPLAGYWWYNWPIAPEPGSIAARAFYDPSWHLVALDAAANTFRRVL